MRFESKNNLRLFQFQEVTLKEIKITNTSVSMVLEALIVNGNHPLNEECVDRFADTASLRFVNGRIIKVIKEGFKYYDADGKLMEEKPDEEIPLLSYDTVFKQCRNVALFDMIVLREKAGDFLYQIGVDINEEDTYWFDISCEETVMEWEKFKNRVM